jgi:DNA-binding transcriptional ArsR family regulator
MKSMPQSSINLEKLFLLHPMRRNIYKIICESPGTYFYRLMSEIPKYDKRISSATLIYHLSKLEEDGLITSEKIDGKRIYFPKNLRTKELERAFMLLKNDNASKMFVFILNNDGCYQNELARVLDVHHDTIRYHTERLEAAELITKEKDGKLVKFHIGRVGLEILNGSMNIFSEAYIRFILSKLADDCHFPEIISRTQDELVIRINCPGDDDITLTLNISNWTMDIQEFPEDEKNKVPKLETEESR